MWQEILYELGDMNLYLIFMLMIAFVGIVILIERGFFLIFVQRLDFARFTHELVSMLKASDFERAAAYCKQHNKSEFASMAASAIDKFKTNPRSVSVEIKQRLFNFLPRISARLTMIPGIASAIILLSIIASMHSLWDAVQVAKATSTVNPANIIQLGISRCLSPCAFGIALSMVLIVGHQLILGVSTRQSHMVQLGAEILNDLLAPKQAMAYGSFAGEAVTSGVQEQKERVDIAESILNNLENIDAEEEII